MKAYFRRIHIEGKENIPGDGPVIYIANHPSAFMDPIIVASTARKPVYFIAAGEYVGRGVKGFVFRKWLHMIPVFRPSTRPEDVHKNKDMFVHCFDHLSKGNSLLIFPEGVSVTERKIKPFKTGVARIARGAELKNNHELNLKIVPVGLNYSDPHRFRSDVFIKIGEPILVNAYISQSENTEFSEVEKLTQVAEEALHKTTLHLETEEDDTLLSRLDAIYSRDLKLELGIDFNDQDREFQMHKNMVEAISYFKENNPTTFEKANNLIDQYLQKLKAHGITDKDIKELKFQKSFRRISSYFLGLPFFLVGFVCNFIPYLSVQFILKKIRYNETFQGSLILAIGLVLFVLFYATVTLLLCIFTPISWWGIFFPFVAYVSGVYAQLYLTAIQFSEQRQNLRKVLKKNKTEIELLISERKALIQFLDQCRLEFDNRSKN